MLVVTSNWAITDGTLAPAVAAGQGVLPNAIYRAACRGGVREDGRYEPIERLDIVLAGDTFDWTLSAAWQGGLKPWHGGDAVRELASSVARRSVRLGRKLIGPLVRWAKHGVRVPAASGGRPARWAVTVPTRLTMLAGDRDAALERVIGTRSGRQPVTMGWQWDDGRVSIRHGHELDPTCGPAPREHRHGRRPTLAESLRVDLVGRFAAAVLGEHPAARRLVRWLAGAHPVDFSATIGAWVASRSGADEGVRTLDSTWRRCVDAWRAEARRTVPTCELEFDVLDALAHVYAAAFTASSAAGPGLSALQPAAPRGSSGLVLGHLAGGWSPMVPVCLGGGENPTVIVCGERAGWPRWQSILPVEERAAVVAIREQIRGATCGGTIVDAA